MLKQSQGPQLFTHQGYVFVVREDHSEPLLSHLAVPDPETLEQMRGDVRMLSGLGMYRKYANSSTETRDKIFQQMITPT